MAELRAYNKLTRLHPRAHFMRMETWAAMGVPDVNGCKDGVEAWIECKEVVKPVRPTTIIKHPKIRPAQITWEAKRRFAGGRTFVALMVGPDFHLLPGYCLKELKVGMTQDRLRALYISPMSLFDKDFPLGEMNDPLPI